MKKFVSSILIGLSFSVHSYVDFSDFVTQVKAALEIERANQRRNRLRALFGAVEGQEARAWITGQVEYQGQDFMEICREVLAGDPPKNDNIFRNNLKQVLKSLAQGQKKEAKKFLKNFGKKAIESEDADLLRLFVEEEPTILNETRLGKPFKEMSTMHLIVYLVALHPAMFTSSEKSFFASRWQSVGDDTYQAHICPEIIEQFPEDVQNAWDPTARYTAAECAQLLGAQGLL